MTRTSRIPDRENRLLELQKKIQDPGYLNTAISEMAGKLAGELIPLMYNSSPVLQDTPSDLEQQNYLML